MFENSCVCSGGDSSLFTYIFECTTIGSGVTVWDGSAIQCEHGTIHLSHTLYNETEKPLRTCNDGDVIAQAIGVDGNSYTSQLNVSVAANSLSMFSNKIVKCSQDHSDTETTIIGSVKLNITKSKQKPYAM